MKSFTTRYCALMVLLFFLTSSTIAQFSADMFTTDGDKTHTGKFYTENPYYRMDMEMKYLMRKSLRRTIYIA